MKCEFLRLNELHDMLATFTIVPGTGDDCGVSFLRGAEREMVVKEI